MLITEDYKMFVTVGAVMYSIINNKLCVVLIKRTRDPFMGKRCLPGGYVENTKSAEQTVKEKLQLKVGLKRMYLEQFAVFTDPSRDFRYRLITIAYLSIGNYIDLRQYSQYGDVQFHSVVQLPMMAFDHKEIIIQAYAHLREKLFTSNIAQFFLPRYFTLKQLQDVYDCILSTKSDVRNFRTMIQKMCIIKATSRTEQNVSHRPAVLYEFITKKIQTGEYAYSK